MRTSLAAALFACSCGATISSGSDLGAGGGDGPAGPFADFPSAPLIDTGAPPDAPSLFAVDGGAASGGPCLAEPEPGALIPRNWLRMRFRLVAPANQLFEIRVHAAAEANDLVVYTTNPVWTMPAPLWSGLAAHAADQPITITVRGAGWDGKALTGPPMLGAGGDVTIAPVEAAGAIVYWTTSAGSALKGFSIGDESVHEVLKPPQAQTACVGCHSATPDGASVGFSASDDAGNGEPARIDLRAVDGSATRPGFLTDAAKALLGRLHQEQPVFSRAHWSPGDRVALTLLVQNARTEIAWTDLEATSQAQGGGWDLLARAGDDGSAASAAWSHDGAHVAYVSSPSVNSGVNVYNGDGDIRIIPYGARKGGNSTALVGASDMQYSEFYPAWSFDDKWIAFTHVAAGNSSYDDAAAELFVVPAAGGAAARLAANDPPACTGGKSPGLTNSWPKWSPDATTVGNRTFYWLTFSSRRAAGNPQLYVAGLVVEGGEVNAKVTTYPALYLWNQPAGENNHTPAWDVFQIPLQ